jgi:small nuclear ribonucleoprotein (snRNP)-like protein
MTDKKQKFKDEVLSRPVRVTLVDGRVLYGKLNCLDQLGNIILMATVEEVAPEYIAPVNESLHISTQGLIKLYNYVDEEVLKDVPEERRKVLEAEFRKNKFYIGQVMVARRSIKAIEVQSKELSSK